MFQVFPPLLLNNAEALNLYKTFEAYLNPDSQHCSVGGGGGGVEKTTLRFRAKYNCLVPQMYRPGLCVRTIHRHHFKGTCTFTLQQKLAQPIKKWLWTQ